MGYTFQHNIIQFAYLGMKAASDPWAMILMSSD